MRRLFSFLQMFWLWFVVLLMLSPSLRADVDKQGVLAMSHVIVQSDAGCSGVIVGDQLVVTAKHCIGLESFRCGDDTSLAHLLWQSSYHDGPAFYRVRSGFGRRSIGILPEPPPVRKQLGLYWAGQTEGRFGRHGGLQVLKSNKTGEEFESLLISTTAVPGASGGAAVYDGKLAGVILAGNQSRNEAAISTNEELRRGYMAAWKLLQANDICTVYVAPNCSACMKFERDEVEGRYVKIPVNFRYVDLSITPISGVDSAPTFEVLGKRYSPANYNGNEVAKWIMSVLRERDESERNIVDLKPVPEPELSPVNVVPVVSSRQQSSGMPEITDWKGVRIIGVVQKNYSSVQSLLAGPISRMIANMSNDQVHFETVFESSEPLRYRSVCASTGITHQDIPVYVFVMVDTIAEVGFIKGQVLAQIERHIDKALTDKMREIPIEVITKRINTDTYNSLAKALGTKEIREDDEGSDLVAVDKSGSGDDDDETTMASHSVATGFSFLSISTLFRVWRFWSGWHHSTNIEQALSLSSALAPTAPVAAVPTAAKSAASGTVPPA